MADVGQYPDFIQEIKPEQSSPDIEALIAEAAILRQRLSLLKLDSPKPMMRDIIEEVAKSNGLTLAKLIAPGRSQHVAHVRQRAMRMCYDAGHGVSAIARMLGNRHHSTIIHGVAADRGRNP